MTSIKTLIIAASMTLFSLTGQTATPTVWTPQAGVYVQYKVPPAMTNKYELQTEVEIPPHYIKQAGTYTLFKSTGGKNDYRKNATPPTPENPDCVGKYICPGPWGWTVNNAMNTAMKCPAFKIYKDMLVPFDAAQSINGEPTCPAK